MPGPPADARVPFVARAAAWIGALALVALHLDFWRPQTARLHAGWIPDELAWRLGWMVAAWLYLLWFCRVVWRDGGSSER